MRDDTDKVGSMRIEIIPVIVFALMPGSHALSRGLHNVVLV